MSDQPRPTPRTDAAAVDPSGCVWMSGDGFVVEIELARELEIESDARAERIAELEASAKHAWSREVQEHYERLEAAYGRDKLKWQKLESENAKLREACNRLLQSDEVQKAWPLDGNKRAQKPRDTFSKASVIVRFRLLLAIHQALAGKEDA